MYSQIFVSKDFKLFFLSIFSRQKYEDLLFFTRQFLKTEIADFENFNIICFDYRKVIVDSSTGFQTKMTKF